MTKQRVGRKLAFRLQNPNCIFCGGMRKTEAEEHCPPRAFFRTHETRDKFPDGFIFPICNACNKSTATHDSIFSIFSRIVLSENGVDRYWETHLNNLAKHMGKQRWGRLLDELNISYRDQHFMAMKQGKSCLREVIGDRVVMRIPNEVSSAINSVIKKLAKGVYFNLTSRIFPRDGIILGLTAYNYDFATGSNVLKPFARLPWASLPVKKGNTDFSDKIQIHYGLTAGDQIMIMSSRFNDAFVTIALAFADFGMGDEYLKKILGPNENFTTLELIQHAEIMT